MEKFLDEKHFFFCYLVLAHFGSSERVILLGANGKLAKFHTEKGSDDFFCPKNENRELHLSYSFTLSLFLMFPSVSSLSFAFMHLLLSTDLDLINVPLNFRIILKECHAQLDNLHLTLLIISIIILSRLTLILKHLNRYIVFFYFTFYFVERNREYIAAFLHQQRIGVFLCDKKIHTSNNNIKKS